MLTEIWAMGHLVGALTALAPAAANTSASTPDLSLLFVPTCNDIELKIATEADDPRRSVATLVTRADNGAHLRAPGDEVAGMRLVSVGYNGARMSPAAWLATPTSLCQALLFEPPGPPRLPSAGREPSAPPASPPGRGFRSSRLRVVPVLRDGAVAGVRLFGVEPGSLLGALGLENGDLLESVNGFELGTPEKALEAYARLRMASRLAVRIVRRGRPMTIDFVIQ